MKGMQSFSCKSSAIKFLRLLSKRKLKKVRLLISMRLQTHQRWWTRSRWTCNSYYRIWTRAKMPNLYMNRLEWPLAEPALGYCCLTATSWTESSLRRSSHFSRVKKSSRKSARLSLTSILLSTRWTEESRLSKKGLESVLSESIHPCTGFSS